MSDIHVIKAIRLGVGNRTGELQYNEAHLAETPIFVGNKVQIVLYKESTEEYVSLLRKHFLIYEEEK